MRQKLQKIAINCVGTHPELLRTIIDAVQEFIAASPNNHIEFITQDAGDFILKCALDADGTLGEVLSRRALMAICELCKTPHSVVLQALFSKGALEMLTNFIVDQTPLPENVNFEEFTRQKF